MTITDQGAVVRQAIRGRLEAATLENVAFDCALGWMPDESGTQLVVGYTVVFVAESPVPLLGKVKPITHTAVLFGPAPDDGQVDEAVTSALAKLQDKAARLLLPPAGLPPWKAP